MRLLVRQSLPWLPSPYQWACRRLCVIKTDHSIYSQPQQTVVWNMCRDTWLDKALCHSCPSCHTVAAICWHNYVNSQHKWEKVQWLQKKKPNRIPRNEDKDQEKKNNNKKTQQKWFRVCALSSLVLKTAQLWYLGIQSNSPVIRHDSLLLKMCTQQKIFMEAIFKKHKFVKKRAISQTRARSSCCLHRKHEKLG